jgi:Ser/Thr protein kinase RdoA (MazF antagonist)
MDQENEEQVLRGPALRGGPSPALFDALRDRYGIESSDGATDLGGSSNLNLLVAAHAERLVVRVYRPWVTAARLADLQLVRRQLARGGVPCAQPIGTREGDGWVVVDGRLVEVEPYVDHDEKMDSWERLEAGLPVLGQIHTLLRSLAVSPAGARAPAANHVEARDALAWTLRGTQYIRSWAVSPAERRLADAAEELAHRVSAMERELAAHLPRQLVHGDFWDNNVFFRTGRVVLVADLDFMGERPRIDDLALTLYYTNSTFYEDPLSDDRLRRLRRLVDAYDRGLDDRLTTLERAALPLSLARTPLCFVGMIASLDTEQRARKLAAEMVGDVAWALAIARDPDRWQAAFG